MKMKEVLAVDCDYTLLNPGFTPYIFLPYGILKRINTELAKSSIRIAGSQFGSIIEYLMEGTLLNYLYCLPGDPEPLVSPNTLADVRKRYGIVVYTRRFAKHVKKDIWKTGLSQYVDDVVGREDVGLGVINKQHIPIAIKRLGIMPNKAIVVSDSPKDLERGKSLGAETWGVLTGYHSEKDVRKSNPDFVFSSLEEGLNRLIQGRIFKELSLAD